MNMKTNRNKYMKDYLRQKENGNFVFNRTKHTSIIVEDADWHGDKLKATIYIATLDITIDVEFTERQVYDYLASPDTIDSVNHMGEHVQREQVMDEESITDWMFNRTHELVKRMILEGEEFDYEA